MLRNFWIENVLEEINQQQPPTNAFVDKDKRIFCQNSMGWVQLNDSG